MAPPSIPEIDRAADTLADVRSERISLTAEEVKAVAHLLELMHKHELKVYEYDGKRVEISALEKIKVKKQKEETNGEDD